LRVNRLGARRACSKIHGMKDFRAKVCVITGAGSGIGRALALELARRGGRLAISDVDADAAAATALLCGAAEVESYRLDVSDRAAVFAHADEVRSRFGVVNLVINNAGVAMHQPVLETSIEDYEWIMAINFWGVVYGSKAFLPHLISSGEAHLVNLSSVFGLIAVPRESGYNASKFAVRGFTEALRQEMLEAGHPVAVSCVHPGGVRTEIARSARAPGRDAADLAQRFERVARLTPARAAEIILRGVERGRPRILVGFDARTIDLALRVLGPGYQQLVYRAAARAERR
jgi:NAD(P)-dependent dehydrogenase (short-subunit alcohol dehydrogenase family)